MKTILLGIILVVVGYVLLRVALLIFIVTGGLNEEREIRKEWWKEISEEQRDFEIKNIDSLPIGKRDYEKAERMREEKGYDPRPHCA